MFVLLTGNGDDARRAIGTMSKTLKGGRAPARVWAREDGRAAAAAMYVDFTPEDAFDQQPLVNERRTFVCQARLDNRDELAAKLGLSDIGATADSGILAQAYDRWGLNCVDALVGDYCFAALRPDGGIEAAVDPLGARRLFWAQVGRDLVVSAQLPAVLAHPRLLPELDLVALARLLDAGVPRDRTSFSDVRSLPGGHCLRWRSGGEPVVERWWRPATEPLIWRKPDDYVEETRELLTRAVAARLRTSRPISSTLSGGLDSGCVTALAADALAAGGEGLTAYTSVPEPGLEPSRRPNWEPDDSGYASAVAALHPNITHRLISPSGLCAAEVWPHLLASGRMPIKAASNMLWLHRICEAMTGAGSNVLLTGQHGNAAFSANGAAPFGQQLRAGRYSEAWRQLGLEATTRGASRLRVAAGAARGGLTGARAVALPLTPTRFLRHAHHPSSAERAHGYAEGLNPQMRRAAFATAPAHAWGPDSVLQWGIEIRDPTADRRLVERLLTYPQAAFRLGGRARGLAREVAAGLLPDAVRYRTTYGAQMPEAPALQAAHAGCYRDLLAQMQASAACEDFLDLPRLAEAFETAVSSGGDYAEALHLDRVFMVGAFLCAFDRGCGPAAQKPLTGAALSGGMTAQDPLQE